jgi:hypothetical protein
VELDIGLAQRWLLARVNINRSVPWSLTSRNNTGKMYQTYWIYHSIILLAYCYLHLSLILPVCVHHAQRASSEIDSPRLGPLTLGTWNKNRIKFVPCVGAFIAVRRLPRDPPDDDFVGKLEVQPA